MTDLSEPGSFDISYEDTIDPLRDRPQTDLGQAGLYQLQIVTGTYALPSCQIMDLVEKVDHCPVDLSVLDTADGISLFFKPGSDTFHMFLRTAVHQKPVEFHGAVSRSSDRPASLQASLSRHRRDLTKETETGLFTGSIKRRPPFLPSPDTVGQTVILQPIHFLVPDPADPAP